VYLCCIPGKTGDGDACARTIKVTPLLLLLPPGADERQVSHIINSLIRKYSEGKKVVKKEAEMLWSWW